MKNNNAVGQSESTAPLDLNRILHSEDPTPYRRLIKLQIVEKLGSISPWIAVAPIALVVLALLVIFVPDISVSVRGVGISLVQIQTRH